MQSRILAFIGIVVMLFSCSCSEEKAMFNGSWVLDKSRGEIPAEHPLEWCGLVIDVQSGTLRIYSSYYDAYGQLTGGVRSGRLSRIANGGKTAEFVMQGQESGETSTTSVHYAAGKVTLGNEPEFLYSPSDLGESLARLGHSWRFDMAKTAEDNGLDPAEVAGREAATLEFDVLKGKIIYQLPPEDKGSDTFWVSGYEDGVLKIYMGSDCVQEIELKFGPRDTLSMTGGGFVVALKRGR